jgi:hypothetical protein
LSKDDLSGAHCGVAVEALVVSEIDDEVRPGGGFGRGGSRRTSLEFLERSLF